MVSHLTFLALEALLPAVVLVVVTGLLLRFAWKERRGQRVLLHSLRHLNTQQCHTVFQRLAYVCGNDEAHNLFVLCVGTQN